MPKEQLTRQPSRRPVPGAGPANKVRSPSSQPGSLLAAGAKGRRSQTREGEKESDFQSLQPYILAETARKDANKRPVVWPECFLRTCARETGGKAHEQARSPAPSLWQHLLLATDPSWGDGDSWRPAGRQQREITTDLYTTTGLLNPASGGGWILPGHRLRASHFGNSLSLKGPPNLSHRTSLFPESP